MRMNVIQRAFDDAWNEFVYTIERTNSEWAGSDRDYFNNEYLHPIMQTVEDFRKALEVMNVVIDDTRRTLESS